MNYFEKKSSKTFVILCIAIGLLIGAATVYLSDYYHADLQRIQAFLPDAAVEIFQTDDGHFVLAPEDASSGLIFYPGGKVEHRAYLPLMKCLASEGVLCVLVEMPFNLAVLDVDAADGIPAQYPQIENWYIGGHSLGGSMAASYLSDHAEEYDGLVLLGSYSTADLSQSELSVLSVYGSNDLVMNQDKYQEYRSNLPADFCEIVIDGGCHAYFGMYGAQDGDGIPTITNEEQIHLTTQAFTSMVAQTSIP